MQERISVIITGATGSAGSGVLKACLEHPAVEKVTILTRKGTGLENPDIRELAGRQF
jgi:FlaA1/EpsC-like NDP-sugar epimerase